MGMSFRKDDNTFWRKYRVLYKFSEYVGAQRVAFQSRIEGLEITTATAEIIGRLTDHPEADSDKDQLKH